MFYPQSKEADKVQKTFTFRVDRIDSEYHPAIQDFQRIQKEVGTLTLRKPTYTLSPDDAERVMPVPMRVKTADDTPQAAEEDFAQEFEVTAQENPNNFSLEWTCKTQNTFWDSKPVPRKAENHRCWTLAFDEPEVLAKIWVDADQHAEHYIVCPGGRDVFKQDISFIYSFDLESEQWTATTFPQLQKPMYNMDAKIVELSDKTHQLVVLSGQIFSGFSNFIQGYNFEKDYVQNAVDLKEGSVNFAGRPALVGNPMVRGWDYIKYPDGENDFSKSLMVVGGGEKSYAIRPPASGTAYYDSSLFFVQGSSLQTGAAYETSNSGITTSITIPGPVAGIGMVDLSSTSSSGNHAVSKGQRGDKGFAGDKGLPGDRGEKGERGDKGERGNKGEQGEKGDRGDAGGAKGDRGEKGDRREQGIPGEPGEKGEKGEKGDSGLSTLLAPDGSSIIQESGNEFILQTATNERFGVVKGQANNTPQTWHHVSASNGLLSINGSALLAVIDQKILAVGNNGGSGGQSGGGISREDRDMILGMIEGKKDTVLALIESKLSNVPGQADYCCKCCVGCKCPCCDHVILDILNLQDLTLETLEYKGVKLVAANDNGHLTFPTQFPDWKPISVAESVSTEIKTHDLLKERFSNRLTFITKWDKDFLDTIEKKKTFLQDFVTETADPSTTYWQDFLTNTAEKESTFWHDKNLEAVETEKVFWQDLITKAVSAEKTYWQDFFMAGYQPGIDFIHGIALESINTETTYCQELSAHAMDEQTVFCKDFSLAAAGKETTFNKEFVVTLHTLDIFYLTEHTLTGYEIEVVRETTIPAKILADIFRDFSLQATNDYFQDFTLNAKSPDYSKNFSLTAQGGTQPPPPPPPPKIFEIVIIRIDLGTPLPHGFFVTVKAKGGAEELMTGKQFSDINTHTAQILQELGAATYSEIILTIPQSAFNAGSYTYNLNNSFILERMIFITIQPDVHVYRQEGDKQINLVHTEQTLLHSNPLAITKKVIVCETPEAKEAKNIALTESNQYSQKVFIESNLPIDLYGTTLSSETSSNGNSTWLRLQEKIRLTRKIAKSDYGWHDGYGSSPIIQTDALGMYVRFMSSESNGYETSLLDHPYCGAVELGWEKPFLDLPISVEADLRFYLCESDRYTGKNESTEKIAAIELPLYVSLKTLHAVKISPPLITLDEDNNYTSFLAVEANDGAAWSFDILSEQSYRYYRISIPEQPDTVSFYLNKVRLYTKTGRTLVSCLLPKSPHLNSVGTWTCPVTITSAAVCDLPSAVSNSFDHSLSKHGCAGRFTTGFYYDRNSLASHTGSLNPHALKNLDQFPTVEITFEKPHRIRSWSLQSVGSNVSNSVFGALATVLVLQRCTLDGTWHILDIVRSQEIFSSL